MAATRLRAVAQLKSAGRGKRPVPRMEIVNLTISRYVSVEHRRIGVCWSNSAWALSKAKH